MHVAMHMYMKYFHISNERNWRSNETYACKANLLAPMQGCPNEKRKMHIKLQSCFKVKMCNCAMTSILYLTLLHVHYSNVLIVYPFYIHACNSNQHILYGNNIAIAYCMVRHLWHFNTLNINALQQQGVCLNNWEMHC